MGPPESHPRRALVLRFLASQEHAPPGLPGRLMVEGETAVMSRKPTPEETPWRSLYFVTGRNSVDGNDYRRGEPIPEAEAVRQGQAREVRTRIPRAACSRCKGRGTHAARKPKGHKEGCGCPACGPCGHCAGTGYEPVHVR